MHSTFFVDFVVEDCEVSSSGEGGADESDSIAGSCIVDQGIPHFWRHLLCDFVDVVGELVEVGGIGHLVQSLLSFEKYKDWPLLLSHLSHAV